MRDYHHKNLKGALIEVGVSLLANEGVEGFSLRKVAKSASVSHTAPYRHFADKDALLAAIAQQGFVMLYDSIERATHQVPVASFEQLYQGTEAYMLFGLEHAAHFNVMFGSVSHIPYPDLAEAAGDAFQQLIRLIEACQSEGLLRDGSSREFAFVVWSLVHGVTVLLIGEKISDTGW